MIAEIERLGGKFLAKGWRASWSPDGRKIAFGKADWPADPKYPALAVLDVETGETHEIAAEGKDPAWSPGDGKYIAYVAGGHQANEELRLIDVSGGTPRRLGMGGYPAWSPDGKTLYFHARDTNKLMGMDPFGEDSVGTAKEIISVEWWYPAIYPAGKLVAYPNGPGLVVVNWENSETLMPWRIPLTSDTAPGWSPDGKYLGIFGFGADGGPRFWVLEVSSGRAVQVAKGPLNVPAWSPDGSKLAFDLRLESGWEIWMIETKVLANMKWEETPQ